MKKELSLTISIAIVAFVVFVSSVVITEKRNIDYIKAGYSTSVRTNENGIVTIPTPTGTAIQYQKNKVTVWIIRLLFSFAVPAFFLFSGLSAGIRKWAQGKAGNLMIALALYFIVYSLIDYLISFPLDVYSGFIRPHAYGLSNQAFAKWLGDSMKSFAISTVFGAALIWVPYTIIKKSPGYWWLYMGLLSVPLLVFITFVSPVLIDPLFNRYEPVQDKELEAKIYEQLNRTVIGNCKVFQVNKSEDTKEMNAYMTGVFHTKRIVLWDTTIQNLTTREVLAITAHEMGHYLMGHIWKGILLGGGLCILILYFVNRCALWIIDKSGGAFGFYKLYDMASLPLLILLINVFMFVSAPVSNAYSRHIETEADRFEIELTKDNNAAATAMVKLHWQSLALPTPGLVYKLWNYDHPTLKERVDFANAYRPWEENKPLKYQKYLTGK